jgi:hypothetical protein
MEQMGAQLPIGCGVGVGVGAGVGDGVGLGVNVQLAASHAVLFVPPE